MFRRATIAGRLIETVWPSQESWAGLVGALRVRARRRQGDADGLVELLGSPHWRTALRAHSALLELGPGASDALATALTGPDSKGRDSAGGLLAFFGDPRGAGTLVARLRRVHGGGSGRSGRSAGTEVLDEPSSAETWRSAERDREALTRLLGSVAPAVAEADLRAAAELPDLAWSEEYLTILDYDHDPAPDVRSFEVDLGEVRSLARQELDRRRAGGATGSGGAPG